MSEKTNRVSIVVMCYKNEDNLLKTIQSILMQTFKDYQIIISDDCSPRFNNAILKQIKNKLDQEQVNYLINKNEHNIGTVKHFNNLIKFSSGEIIVPLSCGDEFYNKDVLKNIVNMFNISNYSVITGRREAMKNGKIKLMPNNNEVDIIKSNNNRIINYICRYFNLISGSCTYYKKTIFEKHGYFDESYTLLEDCPYFLKLLMKDERIGFLDQVCIRYEMSGVSNGLMHPLLKEDFSKLYKNIKADYNPSLSYITKRCINYRINTQDKGFLSKIRYFDVLSMLVYNSIKNK